MNNHTNHIENIPPNLLDYQNPKYLPRVFSRHPFSEISMNMNTRISQTREHESPSSAKTGQIGKNGM